MASAERGARRRRVGARIEAACWALAAVPLAALLADFAWRGLPAEPVEALTHVTGEWALRWLLVCLAITPLRRATGWARLAPARRAFGLAAFAYAFLHFLVYSVLDLGLDLEILLEDVLERPYVTAGALGLLAMLPLALTSTRRSQRRLGRRWVALHRLVYLAAAAGVVHHYWGVKADVTPPLVHGAILAGLLGARALPPLRRRLSSGRAPASPAHSGAAPAPTPGTGPGDR